LAGYEGMAMIRKGQVRNIGGCDTGSGRWIRLRIPGLLSNV
jgi:hypothetical protein